MFQLWAGKQVVGVVGTNKMQSRYTSHHSKKCPNCGIRVETCEHVLFWEESGRVDLLHWSINLVDQWMKDKGTDETRREKLVEFGRGRGGKTMRETIGWTRGDWSQLA